MPSTVAPAELYDVGQVTDLNLLGLVCQFRAEDYRSPEVVKPQLSGIPIIAQLCVNRHSGPVYPGQTVLTDTGHEGPGRALAGPTTVAVVGAGVVPYCVPPSGVPVGATYWVIKEGFARVRSDGGDDVAAGALIQPAADGQVSKHTAGTTDIYCCGRMIEAIGSVADVLKDAIVHFPL